MNSLAKNAFYFLYKYSGTMYAQERLAYLRGNRHMAICLFHRVTDEIPEDGLTVTTGWFRGFCALMRTHFRVVPLGELYRILQTGETPPRGTVAITFDDCYLDNLPAARVLAEYHLPATFFLPSQYVGTDHLFPWDKHLKRMPNLTWDAVKEMVHLGHDIGSHTVSHADLGVIGPEQARIELRESKRTLEDRLQRPIRWLAYPFGGKDNFRPEYLSLAHQLGYEACFSGYGGFVYPGTCGKV